MNLLTELRQTVNESYNAQVGRYQAEQEHLKQRIITDSENLPAIIATNYEILETKMRETAAKGWRSISENFHDHKDYYDVVLKPALYIIEKRLKKDGFLVRLDEWESWVPARADGRIPKCVFGNITFRVEW